MHASHGNRMASYPRKALTTHTTARAGAQTCGVCDLASVFVEKAVSLPGICARHQRATPRKFWGRRMARHG